MTREGRKHLPTHFGVYCICSVLISIFRRAKEKRKVVSRASLTNDKMHAWGWQACLGDYTLFYLAFLLFLQVMGHILGYSSVLLLFMFREQADAFVAMVGVFC